MLFWSDPSMAIKIIIVMLAVSVAISFGVYLKTKKKILTIFSFSLISFLSVYLNVDSRFFDIYNLKWIVKFTLYYWPIINGALLAWLIWDYYRNKK